MDQQKIMASFLEMDSESKIKNLEKMMKQININSQITSDDLKDKSKNGKKTGGQSQVYFGKVIKGKRK